MFLEVRFSLSPAWSLLLERNSDSYRREQRFGSLKDQSQFNVGVDWSPHPAVSATVSYQHGDYWGLTLRSVGDFKAPVPRKYQSLDSSLMLLGEPGRLFF